jgi:hypothetical protein
VSAVADGFVLADKPAGKTSHDITTLVRREDARSASARRVTQARSTRSPPG